MTGDLPGPSPTVRHFLTAAFLLTGFSFTVVQTLAIRELLVSFSGNELSVGLILAAWLLLQALGSGLASRLVPRLPLRAESYAILPAGLALLLFPSFLLVLRVHSLLGLVPGEAVSFLPAFLAAFLVLAPVALLGGAAFVVACRVASGAFPGSPPGPLRRPTAERVAGPAGRVYVLEAVGGTAGGVAFTYLLLPLLTSTQVVLLLVALNALCAALLLLVLRPRRLVAGLLAGLLGVVALLVLLLPLGPALHGRLVAGRWAPHSLAYEGNSPFGNVAVLADAGQVAVFANGTLVLTAPDPDAAAVEQVVHLPALFLAMPPQRVLVIGGGAGGVLAELERYPLQRLDYAEADPLLIQAVRAVPTSLTTAELSDPRLHLALEDGRRFVLRRAGGDAVAYDLVLINLPPPSTLVLNRLYTREFLAQVRALLAPGGVLALPSPPARTYVAPATRDLLACYARTLGEAFPHVRAIPADEQTLWLASVENPLDLDADELAQRWEASGLQGRVLRADYLRYLLDGTAAALLARITAGPLAEANSDARPSGLRYTLAYESARLSPALVPFFRALGQLRAWHVAVGVVLLAVAALFIVRRRSQAAAVAIATTGLAGMTANVLILLAFQVLYGSVYQQVGLLTTAFMAGLSLGGMAMAVWAGRLSRPWRALLLLEGANGLAAAGLAGLLALLLGHADPGSPLAHGVLLLANVVAGASVGLEFPLASHLLGVGGAEGSRAAGALYAADLVGATAGAVLVAAISLPALGLEQTALLVALVKMGSLVLVARQGVRKRV